MKRLDILGIDEISLKKGHQDFVTIITARIGEVILILAVLEGRKKETVKEFFLSIPRRLRTVSYTHMTLPTNREV